jgi:NitT/TauT family transport system permease protein
MSTLNAPGRALLPPVVVRLLVIAGAIAIWETAARLGWINAFTAPAPSAIWAGFGKILTEGGLGYSMGVTFVTAFGAAAFGSMVGISIGYMLHIWKPAGAAYTAWVAAAASAPLVLLYPLFLVIVGRNMWTTLVMGAIGCIPPIALKTKEGLDGVRPVLLNVGRAFNLTPRQQFWMIMFPASLPSIFTGIRIGLLFAILNVIGIEFLINVGGLGQLIATLGDRFDYPQMYAGIFFVILVSVAFFWITERLEQWLLSST